MKDFIIFCYAGCIEMADDGVGFILMLLLNIAIWIGTGFGLAYLTDQVLQETHREVLTASNKVFTKEHTVMVMSGKVLVPITHPDKWVVYFRGIVDCQVSKDLYYQTLLGDTYEVTYNKGISGMTYCISVKES